MVGGTTRDENRTTRERRKRGANRSDEILSITVLPLEQRHRRQRQQVTQSSRTAPLVQHSSFSPAFLAITSREPAKQSSLSENDVVDHSAARADRQSDWIQDMGRHEDG